ncbi:MAG: hypothetical protein ABJC89_23025 [Acidobacteriota bacterium]
MSAFSHRVAYRAVAGALFAVLALSGPALAQCSSPDAGRWVKAGGDPEQIEVYFASCGDTAGAETHMGVKVFVRQSSGGLYQRTPVKAVYVVDKNTRWLLAKVPTGGYVDKMWMRVVSGRDHQNVLKVFIKHESLDSKPSASEWAEYRRR